MHIGSVGEPLPLETLSPKTIRRALQVIFLIMLMDVVGLTLLIPVTPYIVQRYSDDALMVTMVTAIYAAAQFFAAPLIGKLGDRYGRRPVLLISVFGSAVGYILFGIGGALWILFLSRLIDGITAGNMSTASAYIADVSRPEERAKNFSLIGVAWGVGLVVGPAIGSVASQISLEAPAFLAGGVALLSVMVAFFMLPESLLKGQRETRPLQLNDLNPFASISEMAHKPQLGRVLVGLCLFTFAFNGISSIQALFMIDKFDAQPWQVGLLLLLIGVGVVFVQAVLVRRVVPRYGDKPVAVMSLVVVAAGMGITFLAPVVGIFYLLTMLNNGVSGFIFPTLTTLSANRVSPRELGLLMGVTTALASLMNIFGPLWAGVVYDHIAPSAPYWMGAIVLVMGALVLSRGAEDDT